MDERSERVARRFEYPMLVAALLVIPVIVVEQSDVGAPWDTLAAVTNWVIWLAFATEPSSCSPSSLTGGGGSVATRSSSRSSS